MSMISKELNDFINRQLDVLCNEFHLHDASENERVLFQAAKAVEELGEFYCEILSYLKLQRNERVAGYDKKNLESEFADSVIVLLLLSRALDIDADKALRSKIEVIKKRFAAYY